MSLAGSLCQSLSVPHRRQPVRVLAQRGEHQVETDPLNPGGRLLRAAEMDSSYIDLADPAHLEFDYVRWLRIVVRAAGATRVLHIGGGACALARALAAESPQGRQEVCEIDGDVLALAREHMGLTNKPGLKIRHVDGAAHLRTQPDDSWEAIVIDAFTGAQVPPELVSTETMQHARRVAPLTLINVVDNRQAKHLTQIAQALGDAYEHLFHLGQSVGNTLVVGSVKRLDHATIAARAAADPAPARLMTQASRRTTD